MFKPSVVGERRRRKDYEEYVGSGLPEGVVRFIYDQLVAHQTVSGSTLLLSANTKIEFVRLVFFDVGRTRGKNVPIERTCPDYAITMKHETTTKIVIIQCFPCAMPSYG